MAQKSITILGSTGSIGKSTVDIIRREPDKYRVAALTGNQNVSLLAEQAKLLNEMVRLFSKDTPGLPEERLKEFVGHTPAQVLLGCLTGCVVAFLLNLLYV